MSLDPNLEAVLWRRLPRFGYSCEELADEHLGLARGPLRAACFRTRPPLSSILAVWRVFSYKDGIPSLGTVVHHQCLLQRASVAAIAARRTVAIAVLRIQWCQLGYARSRLPFWFVDQPRESGPVT
jgi:hypothetical protein